MAMQVTWYCCTAVITATGSQRVSSTRVAPQNTGKMIPRFSPAIQNCGKKLRNTVSSARSSAMPKFDAAV